MKNSRYFRHDWGARNDPKLLRLVRLKGAVAKALYWDLVEMLYEQGGTLPLEAIEDVSFFNHLEDTETAKFIVYESGLFEYDDEMFWSERQQRDESRIKELSTKRKDAGKQGGVAKAKQNCSKSVANANQTGSKTGYNKIKENKDKSISIGSSLHSEPCPTDEQSDTGQSVQIFPETGNPVEKKPLLSNKQCQQIVDFWNRKVVETGAQFPQVKSLSEDRKAKIRIRWGEFAEMGDPVEVCRTLFAKACASKFLQGDSPKGWSASFDWLFTNGKNWAKVYEGNYDDKTASQQQQPKSHIDRMEEDIKYIHNFFNGNGTEQQQQYSEGSFDEQ